MSESSHSQDTTLSAVHMQWGAKIPLRDGIHVNATVYTPKSQKVPAPCIFTLTPYIGQNYHDVGVYFAEHGFPFLTVDARGRGNSDGAFRPFIQEANDGYDVVEWLAQQPYCNGRVATWGGSYAGYDQWAMAKERPPHLVTIAPAAAAHPGTDFPMRNAIPYPYVMQWLTLTNGRTSQEKIFYDKSYWAAKHREWFESGGAFKELDRYLGAPSPVFQEWISQPHPSAYWDAYSPTAAQYATLSLPILTITGSYDVDQTGALTFYREHLRSGSPEGKANHYLVIGPWDHAGTRVPRAEFGGMTFGPASLVDLGRLHLEWYAWTMQGGPRPAFLKQRVAYYVTGSERWHYADTLEAVTAAVEPYFLDSISPANDVLASGSLTRGLPGQGSPDHYIYDPRDTSGAALESTLDLNILDPGSRTDQRLIYAARGRHLIYHSAPLEHDTEVSGFFRLSAWLSIDQPDTDFRAEIYEIGLDGSSVPLTTDLMRARFRESLRKEKLIRTTVPLRYDFERFTFISRRVKQGSRLRLVIGPINSIYSQKNYNSGGVVADESMQDARPVTVTLFHDAVHPSVLYVPIGRPESVSGAEL